MTIFPIAPSDTLSSFVAQFIFLPNKETDLRFQMVPRNYSAIIFTGPEKEGVNLLLGSKEYHLSQGNVFFAGLGTVHALMHIKGPVIVVMLKPDRTGFFLRENALMFTNNIFCITDTDPEINRLKEELWEPAMTVLQQKDLLESFLLKKAISFEENSYLQRAFEVITLNKGCITSNEVSKQSFTCERNLRRIFTKEVGLSPYTYISMVRFNSFMKEFFQKPETPLEDLAHQYQYYDLSHLNKIAQRFLGNSPSQSIFIDQRINKLLV